MRTPEADPLIASRQHIRLIQDRRARLAAALIDAERQYLTAIKREWDAGHLAWSELHDAWELLRDGGIDGYNARWMEEIGIHRAKIHAQMVRQPNSEDGSWHGAWPLPPDAAYPLKGVSVVYVLFNDTQPVYVGSSHSWKERMEAHRRDGKVWTSWTAHPCRNREAAYELEDRFLTQYMPALNKQGPRRVGGEAA